MAPLSGSSKRVAAAQRGDNKGTCILPIPSCAVRRQRVVLYLSYDRLMNEPGTREDKRAMHGARIIITSTSIHGLTYFIFTSFAQPYTGTWTSRTTPAPPDNWNGVTYANGLFVAVAGSGTGNRVMMSPDGTTWTSRTSAADNAWV